MSQNLYDNPTFFDAYRRLRANPDSANEVEEKPALFALAPELKGKRVLDLGCGCGENCARFARMGAAEVVGVDLSERMLAAAKEEHPELTLLCGDMSELSFLTGEYDVIFSSLAVHYVADFGKLARQVFDLLVPGGYFVFSQEHPLTTAPIGGAAWRRDENGTAVSYDLTDYMRAGRRETRWLVDGVVKYHRPFSAIVGALCRAGFVIEAMEEPLPDRAVVERDPRLEKCWHKPNFLLIRVRKPHPTNS